MIARAVRVAIFVSLNSLLKSRSPTTDTSPLTRLKASDAVVSFKLSVLSAHSSVHENLLNLGEVLVGSSILGLFEVGSEAKTGAVLKHIQVTRLEVSLVVVVDVYSDESVARVSKLDGLVVGAGVSFRSHDPVLSLVDTLNVGMHLPVLASVLSFGVRFGADVLGASGDLHGSEGSASASVTVLHHLLAALFARSVVHDATASASVLRGEIPKVVLHVGHVRVLEPLLVGVVVVEVVSFDARSAPSNVLALNQLAGFSFPGIGQVGVSCNAGNEQG